MVKRASKKQSTVKNDILLERVKQCFLILVGAFSIFILLALFTYSPFDPGVSVSYSNHNIVNAGGKVGAYTADFIFLLFGFFGYLIPFLLVYGIWILFVERENIEQRGIFLNILRWIGVIINFISGSALATILLVDIQADMPQGNGGIIGYFVATILMRHFNLPGTILILSASFLFGLTLFSGMSWLKAIYYTLSTTLKVIIIAIKKLFVRSKKKDKPKANKKLVKDENVLSKNDGLDLDSKMAKIVENEQACDEVFASESSQQEIVFKEPQQPKKPKKVKKSELPNKNEPPITSKINVTSFGGELPPLNLLNEPGEKPPGASEETLKKMSLLVEEKLADFGVKVSVAGVYPGPVVTRYELELAPGVKVSRLTSLSQDLARSLSTSRVRVVEVIPGKPYVGLELPNDVREMVTIKEVIGSEVFSKLKSPLAMALGKDISGKAQAVNLSKMPHLLVAGTTGSGKSVGVNAMIISMLYKATPDDLRLIMIDPKMLELSIYEGIPHLLTPVVTDMTEAASALRWCVKEMDRRYELMSVMGVRNIAGLNDKIAAAQNTEKPLKDPVWIKLHSGQESEAPLLQKLPYIVVIADEFADMMMVVGKKVEELIARLAQKARAAGIHLILATQRPSVDVVTGLIKANIPTRMAFQVSSKIDSRTILDQQGAEQLLGNGDMLYLAPGTGVPTRVHGAFVDDDEVHRVVACWQEKGQPDYIESVLTMESLDEGGDSDKAADRDALYDEAVQIVLDTQRASISSVQRRLRIGYNRAARLIEEMEEAGVVGEMQSNGLREVLIRR